MLRFVFVVFVHSVFDEIVEFQSHCVLWIFATKCDVLTYEFYVITYVLVIKFEQDWARSSCDSCCDNSHAIK